MPFQPDQSYTVPIDFTEQRTPGQSILRVDMDSVFVDIEGAITALSTRLVPVEDGALYSANSLVLNPLFEINARRYAGAPLALHEYAHNRWRAEIADTQYTVASGVATITAGAIGQVLDGRSISTGNHTVTWSGTATCTVDGVAVTNGGVVALTAGVDAVLALAGGTVSEAQVMVGDTARPFRPRAYEIERVLCRTIEQVEHEESIATLFFHESIEYLHTWAVGGEAVGRSRVFERFVLEPMTRTPRYQSLDGSWWGFVSQISAGDPFEIRLTDVEADVIAAQSTADAAAVAGHTHTVSEIVDFPASTPTAWADVTDKPASFPPSTHTHTGSQVTDIANYVYLHGDSRYAPAGSAWPGRYFGDNAWHLDYPIGTTLLVRCRSVNNNTYVALNNEGTGFSLGAGANTLVGTWACRGNTIYNDHGQLFQRVF